MMPHYSNAFNTALSVSVADESDAHRIAAIHIAAFNSNPMLHAQFPSAATQENLRLCIAQKAIDDIRDPKVAVLIVRDQGDIISFAKWSLPVRAAETYEKSPWLWPQGTDLAVLEEWMEKVESAKQKVLSNAPCYHLIFLGTDPRHERRGAASLLLKWGLDHCITDDVPAYLESTVDAGPLYERHGFKATESISMVLENVIEHGKPIIYQETCYLYTPSGASDPVES